MSRSITIEDLYEFVFLSRPRISPDGKQIAYVATEIEKRTHTYRSAIWMVPVAGGEARRVTAEPASAVDPAWSPDGKYMAPYDAQRGTIQIAERIITTLWSSDNELLALKRMTSQENRLVAGPE